MSPFHSAASLLANFNNTISMISTTRLFIYISCDVHEPVSNKHRTILKSWPSSSFRILLTCQAHYSFAVTYTCYQRGVAVLGVWPIFAFIIIIKHTLDIKRIFPCSFGNKHIHLLTHVYGTWIVNRICNEGSLTCSVDSHIKVLIESFGDVV